MDNTSSRPSIVSDEAETSQDVLETKSPITPRPKVKKRDPMVVSTIVIACASVLNLFATGVIVFATRDYVQATKNYVQVSQDAVKVSQDTFKVSQDTFKVTNRPYIGIAYIGPPPLSGSDTKNDIMNYNNRDNERPILPFFIAYQNYGNIPARDITVKLVVRVNGEEQPMMNYPSEPFTLFPNQGGSVGNQVETSKIPSVLSGSSTLDVEVEIKYKGTTQEEYITRDKGRYDATSPCGCYFNRMAAEVQ